MFAGEYINPIDHVEESLTWLVACHSRRTSAIGNSVVMSSLMDGYKSVHPRHLERMACAPINYMVYLGSAEEGALDQHDRLIIRLEPVMPGRRGHRYEVNVRVAKLTRDGRMQDMPRKVAFYDGSGWSFGKSLGLSDDFGISAALSYKAAESLYYTADIAVDGVSLRIPGNRDEFRELDGMAGRKALVHWVRAHKRRRPDSITKDVSVRAHTRGREQISLFGYPALLTPPRVCEAMARGAPIEPYALAASMAFGENLAFGDN